MAYSNELVQEIRKLYADLRIVISKMEGVPEIGNDFTNEDVYSLDSEYTIALGDVQSLWKRLGEIIDAVDSGKYDANSPV